jgi:hypothetical protein
MYLVLRNTLGKNVVVAEVLSWFADEMGNVRFGWAIDRGWFLSGLFFVTRPGFSHTQFTRSIRCSRADASGWLTLFETL